MITLIKLALWIAGMLVAAYVAFFGAWIALAFWPVTLVGLVVYGLNKNKQPQVRIYRDVSKR